MNSNASPLSLAIAMILCSTAPLAKEPGESEEIQEIVVTATRREQSVLDVPYNITAVSGRQLEDSGVTDPNALVRTVPGLTTLDDGARGSGLRNNLTLRGLNADVGSNQDDNPKISQATVSTYIGEAPLYFPLKLVDLDRVEVLRGPQGTLYGSGSVGGTVRYIPKKAELNRFSTELDIQSSSTEHSHSPGYDGHITINAPINDNWAFRGTAGYEYLAGFIDARGLVQQSGSRLHPGAVALADPADPLGSPAAAAPERRDSNDARIAYGRANLRFKPNDGLDLNLNLYYQRNEANDRNEDNRFFGSHEPYVNYTPFTSPQDSELKLVDVDVEVDVGFARLSSSSAYSDVSARSVSGGSSGFLDLSQYYFGYPRLIAPISRDEKHKIFTQEMRLVSNGRGKFDWVVGAFYENSKIDFNMMQTMPGINAYTNAVLGTTTPVDFTDTLAYGGTFQTFQDMAIFGEPTYHLTDRWQVTAGLRIFRQKTTGSSGVPLPYASRTTQYFIDGVANNDFFLGGFVPTNDSASNHVIKLNTSYKLGESALAFATYAEGFRAGGANQLPETDPLGNDNRPLIRYKSDTAKNYEVGVKGALGARLTYGATAFYVRWKDFQTNLVSPFGVSFVGNVAGAESKGMELETSGKITDRLDFNLSYAWTKANVTDAFEVRRGDPTTTIAPGTTLPGAPRHTLFGSLTYLQPLGSSTLSFRVDASYRSKATSFFREIDTMVTDDFTVFNAFTVTNAAMTWRKDHYSVAIFGKNLGNARGTSIVSTEKFMGPRDQGEGVITPRTFGVRFNWSME